MKLTNKTILSSLIAMVGFLSILSHDLSHGINGHETHYSCIICRFVEIIDNDALVLPNEIWQGSIVIATIFVSLQFQNVFIRKRSVLV